MPKALIFSKDGKDLKWGIETKQHCWKCHQVFHKEELIGELMFGCIQEDSFKNGYSARQQELTDQEVEDFYKLNAEELAEKEAWERQQKDKIQEEIDKKELEISKLQHIGS